MPDKPTKWLAQLPENMLVRSFTLARDAFTEDGSFEGLASAFGVVDSYGTQWDKGAWTKGGLTKDSEFALLWMHSPYEPIGTFGAEEKDDGLWINGKYDDTDEGVRARKRALSGSAAELSVGFIVRDLEGLDLDDEDEQEVHFTNTELVEVSQITRNFASQPGAALTDVRLTLAGRTSGAGGKGLLARRRKLAIARLELTPVGKPPRR